MKVVIFLALVFAASAAKLPDLTNKWHGLKVTWNINPLSQNAFNDLPRTIDEKSEFTFRDDLCKKRNSKFVGQRYWANKDPALSLLFDRNGYIAGIQTSVAKSLFKPAHMNYVDDGEYWTLTAYFIDPSLICGEGRTQEEFEKTGTGTGLWIQQGPKPISDVYNVPLKEKDIKNTKWGSGRCHWTMGVHYWYNVTSDMNCNDFQPECLLYNEGKLTAFCFAINGKYSSDRYDSPHANAKSIAGFMNPVPKCFTKNPTYSIQSTMHIYFAANPQVTSNC